MWGALIGARNYTWRPWHGKDQVYNAVCLFASTPVRVSARLNLSHAAPQLGCDCGFWAYWTTGWSMYQDSWDVSGVVEGFGKTIIGPSGFRSQKCRITALTTDRDAVRILKRRYRVPVYTSLEEMISSHKLTTAYSVLR